MNEQRIKLAEAMGWQKHPDGEFWKQSPTHSIWLNPVELPDPFTDANDDYAVLEHFRNKKKKGGGTYKDDINEWIEWHRSVDYQIGDYARAALKVLP